MRDDLLNKKINIKNYCLQKASENISKISHEGADHSPQTAKGRL